MQDRYYAVAIAVVLGICCLGLYVAVSGYLITNPLGVAPSAPAVLTPQVVIAIPTDTPAPTKPVTSISGAASVTPVPSPLGAFQTIAAAATLSPGTPPIKPPATPVPSPGALSCSGFQFCPKGGPPDANLGPGGNECPRNYIWGRVVDVNNRGIPNMRIRYKVPTGEMSETHSKNVPDPPGKYDILAPSGTFTIWMLDQASNQTSPRYEVTVPQPYSIGSPICPSRVDFVQQR